MKALAYSVVFFLLINTAASAQSFGGLNLTAKVIDCDTNYINPFPEKVTGRVYLSEKYTDITIEDVNLGTELSYKPNTTLNLGIGVTVKSYTLNLAYGFKFLNPDVGQGDTRYLDLQSHIYTRALVIDFYGQFYKGLYLENTRELDPNYPEEYYLRPDIYEQILGITGYYLFNNQKYSFRAGMTQNEQQLKSAGSWMAGIETYYSFAVGDSALIPTFTGERFQSFTNAERMAVFKAGPSGGYAHTFVVAKKFFLMLSLTVNVGIGNYVVQTEDGTRKNTTSVDLNTFGRFALGYNNEKWYLGITTIDNSIGVSSKDEGLLAQFGIGNVRFNYAWRFVPKPRLQKYIDYLP